MNPVAILILLLLILVFFILPALGLGLLFKKAGEAPWRAFVPIYNSVVMLQICERPFYWAFMQFIPFLGLFYSAAIWIEFIRTFGKTRFYQYALIPLTAGLYFLYLGWNPRNKFTGPHEMKRFSRPDAWKCIGVSVVTIAIITGLRSFVYESYSIPTTSMEKTLLRGDCILVSKLSYGPRLPITPLALPFIPGIFPAYFKDAYSKSIQLSYHRPSASPVGRGDVIVFNFPIGDTVINMPEFQSMRPYYDVCRELGRGDIDSGRQIVLGNPDQYPLAVRPIDKEETYIKRCVAIPGDTLLIRDQLLYIDGKAQPVPPETETYCRVRTSGQPLDDITMKELYGLDMNDPDEFRPADSPNQYYMLLTWSARESMLKSGLAGSIIPDNDSTTGEVFPYDTLHAWTRDNYGPVWIPQKGATLVLTPENYPLYERVIRVYEGNELEMRAGKIFLNGREENKYRFKMDYYWVLGDALHGSQDSRYWGFVPEDHVIGKAWLIWASWNGGLRWNRLFTKIK
jgi:signal peptidase I